MPWRHILHGVWRCSCTYFQLQHKMCRWLPIHTYHMFMIMWNLLFSSLCFIPWSFNFLRTRSMLYWDLLVEWCCSLIRAVSLHKSKIILYFNINWFQICMQNSLKFCFENTLVHGWGVTESKVNKKGLCEQKLHSCAIYCLCFKFLFPGANCRRIWLNFDIISW